MKKVLFLSMMLTITCAVSNVCYGQDDGTTTETTENVSAPASVDVVAEFNTGADDFSFNYSTELAESPAPLTAAVSAPDATVNGSPYFLPGSSTTVRKIHPRAPASPPVANTTTSSPPIRY